MLGCLRTLGNQSPQVLPIGLPEVAKDRDCWATWDKAQAQDAALQLSPVSQVAGP